MSKIRWRDPRVYTHFARCDLCGDDQAGRGTTAHGAQSGLGQHRRRKHGILPAAARSAYLAPAVSARTTAIMDAFGEFCEDNDVSLAAGWGVKR